MIFLVKEVDGTSFTGHGKIVGYVEADSLKEAERLVGDPPNLWNSYSVQELKLFRPEEAREAEKKLLKEGQKELRDQLRGFLFGE